MLSLTSARSVYIRADLLDMYTPFKSLQETTTRRALLIPRQELHLQGGLPPPRTLIRAMKDRRGSFSVQAIRKFIMMANNRGVPATTLNSVLSVALRCHASDAFVRAYEYILSYIYSLGVCVCAGLHMCIY